MTDAVREVELAERRIRKHVRDTPVESSPGFGGHPENQVYFKCENLQFTGSFKVRGALSKVLSLSPAELERGLVTASTGNHGAACAFALHKVGASSTIFVPENASPTKLANILRHGGSVQHYGTDSAQTEDFARGYARERGLVYLPPYNDPEVIGGQGTIAVELLGKTDQIDAVLVSVGGGGLISGIASHFKRHSPHTRIIGCSPVNSQVMFESVKAGRILDLPSSATLSDGTAGGIEPDSITFPIVRGCVDEFVSVTEEEIATAMRTFISTHSMLIEGSAGVAIAAYLKNAEQWRGKRVVIVLCGGNISLDTLRQVVCHADH